MSTVQIQEIPIGDLRENPNNPRKHFDAKKLEELAASVKEKGVRQPIEVRGIAAQKGVPGHYEIVYGNRRFRAAKLAALMTVPAIVVTLTDEEAFDIAVTENLQRDDMTPLDEARSYAALMKAHPKRNTVKELAARFGKPESYVYRRVKLLELIPAIQAVLDDGRLTIAHAERLARLTPALQKEAFASNSGVVFDHRPLLVAGDNEGDDKNLGLDNLRPVHDLDAFIRARTAINPIAEDTRHFQPALAEAIDVAAGAIADQDIEHASESEADEILEEARASLLELSDDIFVRVHLRAKPSDSIPLNRNKWKEIKGAKNRCDFAQRGVVTHGGPYRVLEVCAKKGCPKHFPIDNRRSPKAHPGAADKKPTPQQREEERRKAAEAEARHELEGQVDREATSRIYRAIVARFKKFDGKTIKPLLEALTSNLSHKGHVRDWSALDETNAIFGSRLQCAVGGSLGKTKDAQVPALLFSLLLANAVGDDYLDDKDAIVRELARDYGVDPKPIISKVEQELGFIDKSVKTAKKKAKAA